MIDLTLGNVHTSTNWPVFATNEPSDPDNCITVYDATGENNGRTMPDGEQQTKHAFQVRVRAVTHAVGFAKANAIAIALDEDVYQETVHVDSTTYLVHAVSQRGDILSLGKGNTADRRSLFTINGLVVVRQQ